MISGRQSPRSRRCSPSSGQRSRSCRNASGISKPGWGRSRGTRPGLRRPTCRARPSARHPGPVAEDAVAKPVTSLTSGPWRQADGRGDLLDARPGPVRLLGWGVHREHGWRRRAPALPSLIQGCLQAAPDVAGPVTSCAFPTDPRERLPSAIGYGVKKVPAMWRTPPWQSTVSLAPLK